MADMSGLTGPGDIGRLFQKHKDALHSSNDLLDKFDKAVKNITDKLSKFGREVEEDTRRLSPTGGGKGRRPEPYSDMITKLDKFYRRPKPGPEGGPDLEEDKAQKKKQRLTWEKISNNLGQALGRMMGPSMGPMSRTGEVIGGIGQVAGMVPGPFGVAARGAGMLGEALFKLPDIIKRFGETILEENFRMGRASPGMSAVQLLNQAWELMRSIQVGQELAPSALKLLESQQRLKTALQPMQIEIQKAWNEEVAKFNDNMVDLGESIGGVLDDFHSIFAHWDVSRAGGPMRLIGAESDNPLPGEGPQGRKDFETILRGPIKKDAAYWERLKQFEHLEKVPGTEEEREKNKQAAARMKQEDMIIVPDWIKDVEDKTKQWQGWGRPERFPGGNNNWM